jgi:hypothetical protein
MEQVTSRSDFVNIKNFLDLVAEKQENNWKGWWRDSLSLSKDKLQELNTQFCSFRKQKMETVFANRRYRAACGVGVAILSILTTLPDNRILRVVSQLVVAILGAYLLVSDTSDKSKKTQEERDLRNIFRWAAFELQRKSGLDVDSDVRTSRGLAGVLAKQAFYHSEIESKLRLEFANIVFAEKTSSSEDQDTLSVLPLLL